jgi:rusticyanin
MTPTFASDVEEPLKTALARRVSSMVLQPPLVSISSMTDTSPATQPDAPSPAPSSPPVHRRVPPGVITAVAASTLLVAGVAFAVGRNSASPAPESSTSVSQPGAPARPTGQQGCVKATAPPMNMTSPDASLGQMIGREAGTALAGDSPLTVTAAQVSTLGNQVPAGARIDTCLNRITFTTASVSVIVEAVPPDNPDMTFRIAGLVNPTVVVPRNAQVRIEYINADSDEAHAFVITDAGQPLTFRPAAPPAFPGAAAGPIGDPTAAGHGARDIAFTASAAGTYRYLCPMPGHAEMGMYGSFVVQ